MNTYVWNGLWFDEKKNIRHLNIEGTQQESDQNRSKEVKKLSFLLYIIIA